jgi:Zn-dependent peptidase ImmA (M78 family)
MERITNINPQRLAWCCADAGVAADEVVAETGIRADKLQAVLAGDGGLTFPQLRSLAEFFGRSVLFFLETEAVDAAYTHSPQFRTLAGQKPDLSRRVRQLVERVERQRALYLDLLDDLDGAGQPRFDPPRLPDDPVAAARIARDWLALGTDNTFDGFRTAVENKGVLVFRTNGYAGKWQIAKESPILGFALYDPLMPVVVVKKQDALARQSFTLMHELGHVLLHRSSSVDDESDLRATQGRERDANQFAAQLLVPDAYLATLRDTERPHDMAQLDAWLQPSRKAWGVSAEVILLRLVGVGRLSQAVFDAHLEWRRQQPPPQGDGGSRAFRHREPRHLFGDRFVRTVLGALGARQISLSKASDYLDGLKVSDLHKLERLYAGV